MTANIEEKRPPAVIIFAGPNGSGKSTITKTLLDNLEDFSGEYINADDIARNLASDIPDDRERNREAARIAEEQRLKALSEGRDFAFETVMSTPEKVALMTQAKAHGYQVSLVFVTTEDPEINVGRVADRVATGGHAVPPDTVRRRYVAAMDLLPAAFEHADHATVWDNSEDDARLVATKAHEQVEFPAKDIEVPWVAEKLAEPYMQRLASRKLLSASLKDGRPVQVAEAVHGKDYVGQVLRATSHHVLQEVEGELFLHDRKLAATATFDVGQEQAVSYRYEYGKIAPVDAPAPAARPPAPK
ncbi:zeta toxin family protein [Burkholderia ubonensis]|uniref:Uncharacterized protein n=1 Tax=Burkholderia ubonensis subsp. mesacidophila TaxID=265293 RepID=A0A2A4FBJ5_9BURK|nr:zeta toxin family protein [Burkholderia ubonensis]PCE30052.1 hypothetical protein BZL54_23085 [Burkholderia ubonensis subsp. mesacidophila]